MFAIDLVLFRYGGTGVQDAIKRAVDTIGMIPVFPVKNINNFTSDSGNRNNGVFRDCGLVRPGTTVGELAHLLDLGKFYLGAETVGSIQVFFSFLFSLRFCFFMSSQAHIRLFSRVQLAETDALTLENNILSFKLSKLVED